jgi:hypothetical protein
VKTIGGTSFKMLEKSTNKQSNGPVSKKSKIKTDPSQKKQSNGPVSKKSSGADAATLGDSSVQLFYEPPLECSIRNFSPFFFEQFLC